MGKVLVRKAEAPAGSPLQTQLMMGGGGGGMGGGMFLTPERPITPHAAGMQAAGQLLDGQGYSNQQQQNVAQTASRGAQMAGKYGGLAAMLGSGLKNIYDSSIQGQAPSLAGMATSAYGANQFMKPLATRAGAQFGAQRGMNQVGRSQGDIDREIQEGMANTNQGRDGESSIVRNPILPRTADGVAEQAAEQQRAGATPASIGRAGLDVSYSAKPEFQGFGNLFDGAEQELRERQNRTRAGRVQPGTAYYGPGTYGPQIAPPTQMSVGRASNVLAGRTRPPIDTSFARNQSNTPTDANSTQMNFGNNPVGMAGQLNNALPDSIAENKRLMEEQEDNKKEEKEEMDQKQLESLQENLKERRDEQSMGA